MTVYRTASKPFLLLILLNSAACQRTQSSAAQIQSATSSPFIPFGEPKPAVWRLVSPLEIQTYVKPAQGTPLDGIWYCRAKAGQLGLTDGAVLLSLANAKHDAVKDPNGYAFWTYDPLNYGFNAAVNPYSTVSDKTPVQPKLAIGYDVEFDDATNAHLVIYSKVPGGAIKYVDPSSYSFTMTKVTDDHWIRKSSMHGQAKPNYDLLKIFNADGSPVAANWALYKSDAISGGSPKLLMSVAADSPLSSQPHLESFTPDDGGSVATSDEPDFAAAALPGANSDLSAVNFLSEVGGELGGADE